MVTCGRFAILLKANLGAIMEDLQNIRLTATVTGAG
jgi:hypothetical protein